MIYEFATTGRLTYCVAVIEHSKIAMCHDKCRREKNMIAALALVVRSKRPKRSSPTFFSSAHLSFRRPGFFAFAIADIDE